MQLWAWWEGSLDEYGRDRFLECYDRTVKPAEARALWQFGGDVVVITPLFWSDDADHPWAWTLAPDVRNFVAARDYERRHPGEA
jgi:hypothetical protein